MNRNGFQFPMNNENFHVEQKYINLKVTLISLTFVVRSHKETAHSTHICCQGLELSLLS